MAKSTHIDTFQEGFDLVAKTREFYEIKAPGGVAPRTLAAVLNTYNTAFLTDVLLSRGPGDLMRLSIVTSSVNSGAFSGLTCGNAEIRMFEEIGTGLVAQGGAANSEDIYRDYQAAPISEGVTLPFLSEAPGLMSQYLSTLNDGGGAMRPAFYGARTARWNGISRFVIIASSSA